MGTTCLLAGVAENREVAERALHEAEAAVRRVEALMSSWLDDSEVSRLNAAPVGVEVALSSDTLEVLRAARRAALESEGAFDVTCGPLLEAWHAAGRCGILPSEAALQQARASCGWGHIELTDSGAVRRRAEARVDLGGIAKGYGIDAAVEALEEAGLLGGLVDVGGDLRCFGAGPDQERWQVEIRNPFGGDALAHVRARDAAVCTSGNYARFVQIGGRQYSHIVDPRSGRPADGVPSATVVADHAITADIWATVLSVLGEDGLGLLPAGVEALVVLGSANDFRIVGTEGLRSLLEEPLPAQTTVFARGQPATPASAVAGAD
jgi:thiamine biosynthesis lipoprotein